MKKTALCAAILLGVNSCNGITLDLLAIYAGYKALQGSRPAQAVLAFSGVYYCTDQANFHTQQIRLTPNRFPDIKDYHSNMSIMWGLGSLACLGTCIYLLNKTDKTEQKPENDKQVDQDNLICHDTLNVSGTIAPYGSPHITDFK